MDRRTAWAWAMRGWLLTGTVVLAYANLVRSGVRLMGPLPTLAMLVPLVGASALTWYACASEPDAGAHAAGDDALRLTCGTLAFTGVTMGAMMLAARAGEGGWLGALGFCVMLAGAVGMMVTALFIITLPFLALLRLLAGPLRGRAAWALALQLAVVAGFAYAPGAFVDEHRNRDAELDCTLECRNVARALEKWGKPPPRFLDEPVFQELQVQRLLKKLPRHRIDGELVSPKYYMLNGHVVCMRHFRGRY